MQQPWIPLCGRQVAVIDRKWTTDVTRNGNADDGNRKNSVVEDAQSWNEDGVDDLNKN